MLSPEDRETITFLRTTIGPTLTVALTGSTNRFEIDDWDTASVDSTSPTAEQLERLRFARQEFERVATHEDADVARLWFISANVGEDAISPVEAIAEDRFDEVTISATRLINDEWS